MWAGASQSDRLDWNALSVSWLACVCSVVARLVMIGWRVHTFECCPHSRHETTKKEIEIKIRIWRIKKRKTRTRGRSKRKSCTGVGKNVTWKGVQKTESIWSSDDYILQIDWEWSLPQQQPHRCSASSREWLSATRTSDGSVLIAMNGHISENGASLDSHKFVNSALRKSAHWLGGTAAEGAAGVWARASYSRFDFDGRPCHPRTIRVTILH